MPIQVDDANAAANLWETLIPAGVGLLGVLLGGAIQTYSSSSVSNQQRRDRLLDEAKAREREAAKEEAQRQFVRAVLARHLEAFARSCAEAMWHNGNPEIDGAAAPPSFPAWPAVQWELLGSSEMIRIRDIEIRVAILRDSTEGAVIYGASHEDEARSFYAEGAAAIGLEAWNLAQRLRTDAGVDAFRFPREGANYAEALQDHVEHIAQREREARERRAARIAAGDSDLVD
ncbi:hypothetical protein [Phenylobacterium koreense]|uniref:Secreted protein n=1 Tax=Phenylobacterium koreense TaxID=266125 RepID=A0ABV2EM79_9CAUL